jgi:hypothetical protein
MEYTALTVFQEDEDAGLLSLPDGLYRDEHFLTMTPDILILIFTTGSLLTSLHRLRQVGKTW